MSKECLKGQSKLSVSVTGSQNGIMYIFRVNVYAIHVLFYTKRF